WLAARLGDLEAETRRQQENSAVLTGAERDQRRYMAEQQAGDLASKSNSEVDAIKKELVAQIDELESLERLQLLSEQRVRELQDAYPGVFKAGMGAEAVRAIVAAIELNDLANSLRMEIQSTSGQRRKKAMKRLRVVEAFRKSGNRPEWMFFTALPVIPPDLRPMVQL